MKVTFSIYLGIYVATLACCYIYNYRYNKQYSDYVTVREILGLDDGSHFFQHVPILNTVVCICFCIGFIEEKLHKYVDKFLNIKIK